MYSGDVTGVTSVIDTPAPEFDATGEVTPMSMQPQASTRRIVIADGASFVDALRMAEIERTRRSVPILLGLSILATIYLIVFGGDSDALQFVYVGAAFGIGAAVYLYYITLDEERYTEPSIVVANSILILAVYTAVYFLGLFSAASSVIVLATFLMGVDRKGKSAFALYSVVAVSHLVFALLFVGGIIEDVGIISSKNLTTMQLWSGEALMQLLLLASFFGARAIRVQLAGAIDEHDANVREHARRGALLEEAREALDRAQYAKGRGAFTGQKLGSYELSGLLGRGGTGEVYEATHVETQEKAAVKLLSLPALGVRGHLTRFIREAEAAATVVSPYVVKLLEVSNDKSPLPYIAMEKLEGEDLSYFLRDTGALPLDDVVEMVNQVAKGLEAARKVGIVHRDITPRNLFRTGGDKAPLWKILDFGISKLETTTATLTQGQVIGTPRYMAPEQSQGMAVDHRADVYSLAAIAYRALTGHPPISGKNVAAILHNTAYQMPERPSPPRGSISATVDDVLLIGLAKKPGDRFATALELASALAAAAEEKLQPSLKKRAAKLAKRQPWGSKVPRRERRNTA